MTRLLLPVVSPASLTAHTLADMIRALWSPKVCMLERRENVLKLHDSSGKHSLYERTVTFEGEEFNSRIDPVRGHALSEQVQAVADAIVSHIAEVSFQKLKITRLVLNFKVNFPSAECVCPSV